MAPKHKQPKDASFDSEDEDDFKRKPSKKKKNDRGNSKQSSLEEIHQVQTPQKDLPQPLVIGACLNVILYTPSYKTLMGELTIGKPLLYNSNRNLLFECTLKANKASFQVILKVNVGSKSYIDHGPLILTYNFNYGSLTPKGISLKDYISNNSLSDTLKIHFIKDLLWEVAGVHDECLIHNDIKPDNIIVYEEYGNLCRLIDYEFSKSFDTYNHKRERCYLKEKLVKSQEGTERYYPPEKESSGNISPKSDIYSLGLVFGNILLGFSEDSDSRSFKKKIKIECERLDLPELGVLVAKMISHKKVDRPFATDIIESMKWKQVSRVNIIQQIVETIVKTKPGIQRNLFEDKTK